MNINTFPVDYEHITKVLHYNMHPSNVECINIVEHLSFNLGTAFKYVMRRDYKNNAVQDLKKALYYIQRDSTQELVKEHFDLVLNNITRVIEAETVTEAKIFYDRVRVYVIAATDKDHGKPTSFKLALIYKFIEYAIIDLIKKYEIKL